MTNEVLQKTASDEQNISSSNGLEPSLRFKNFTKKWNSISLKEIGTFQKGAPLSKADISQEGNPFILYGELYTTYSEVTYNVFRKTNKKVDKIYFSNVGDVILPTSGETPEEIATATCIMIPDVILAGDLYIFRQNKIDGRILSYIINHTVNGKISRIAQGKSVVHVLSEELGKIIINYPTNDEQQKIADFLSLIDQRIKKQRQLVESLKKYKRGLFLKLYNDSEKKSYKICDLGKYCATGALSKDDIDVSGKYPCILYGELFTKYGEVIKQVVSRTNVLPTYLSGTNEILFPSSTTADAQSLIFPSSLKIKNISLGGDLFTIKLKNEFDSDFISYLVNFEYKNTLARYAQGITIIHLHYTDIKEQVIDIPNVDTQFNISGVMRKIETIIEMNINELNSLLLMKKGFLQKMFI